MGERAGLAVALASQEEMAELGLEQGHLSERLSVPLAPSLLLRLQLRLSSVCADLNEFHIKKGRDGGALCRYLYVCVHKPNFPVFRKLIREDQLGHQVGSGEALSDHRLGRKSISICIYTQREFPSLQKTGQRGSARASFGLSKTFSNHRLGWKSVSICIFTQSEFPSLQKTDQRGSARASVGSSEAFSNHRLSRTSVSVCIYTQSKFPNLQKTD
jgi:hypothetical protein